MTKNELYGICLERCANNDPDAGLFSEFAHLLEDDTVNIEKIQRLEREADCLADMLACFCYSTDCFTSCPFEVCLVKGRVSQWRGAARAVVMKASRGEEND